MLVKSWSKATQKMDKGAAAQYQIANIKYQILNWGAIRR
jgi:hypothetical protein